MTPRPVRPFAYHSAHSTPSTALPCDGWSGRSGVAVVHDVTSGGLPSEFSSADVLYADIPWRAGYGRFQDRAEVEDAADYKAFLGAVNGLANSDPRPVVLLVGAHAVKHFSGYEDTARVLMPAHGDLEGTVLYWRGGVGAETTTLELLNRLAVTYETVGDFCAGYGLAGWVFRRHGKRFVLSDINRQCVGHIAEHAHEWEPAEVDA